MFYSLLVFALTPDNETLRRSDIECFFFDGNTFTWDDKMN
jgi:hypothetical protein